MMGNLTPHRLDTMVLTEAIRMLELGGMRSDYIECVQSDTFSADNLR